MENARATRAVRNYVNLTMGYDVRGFVYVMDGDGERWPVLVSFDECGHEARFTLVGQDFDGTVSRKDMEDAMWRYFRMYPDECTSGMSCWMDTATTQEIAPGVFGVTYHVNAWNGRKGE